MMPMEMPQQAPGEARQATQHGCGEALDEEGEAHVGIEQGEGRHQHRGGRGDGGSRPKGTCKCGRCGADKGRCLGVVRGGLHHLAGAGQAEECRKGRHDDDRAGQHCELLGDHHDLADHHRFGRGDRREGQVVALATPDRRAPHRAA